MSDIIYRQPNERDYGELIRLSGENIGMTDVYTYVRLHPELKESPRLWLAEDKELLSVYYDDGSYFTVNGIASGGFTAARALKGVSLFEPPKEKFRLSLMVYSSENAQFPQKSVDFEGKELLDVLRLLSGSEKLPDHLEKRYVDIVRGINAGLCRYCGIYENKEPVSCGGIVASNEKYALIGNIFTKEEYRSRGYASDVIKALVNAAKEKNLIPILYCEKNMIRFYEKNGFTIPELP